MLFLDINTIHKLNSLNNLNNHHLAMAGPFSPLPEEVSTCLKNARFLHLATCNGNIPHVSLMVLSSSPIFSFPH